MWMQLCKCAALHGNSIQTSAAVSWPQLQKSVWALHGTAQQNVALGWTCLPTPPRFLYPWPVFTHSASATHLLPGFGIYNPWGIRANTEELQSRNKYCTNKRDTVFTTESVGVLSQLRTAPFPTAHVQPNHRRAFADSLQTWCDNLMVPVLSWSSLEGFGCWRRTDQKCLECLLCVSREDTPLSSGTVTLIETTLCRRLYCFGKIKL